MSKTIFTIVSVLFLGLSFASCGGDDELDDYVTVQSETTGKLSYIEPCLDWGNNQDHVISHMNQYEGFTYMTGSTYSQDYLLYTSNDQKTSVYYYFRNGLYYTMVQYRFVDISNVKVDVMDKLSQKYNVEFKRNSDADNVDDLTMYDGECVINGRTTTISVGYGKISGLGYIEILYLTE